MKKLMQLLRAARSMSPQCEVKFHGTEDESQWILTVMVGGAILFESRHGTADAVIEEASRKLKSMSARMRAVLIEPDEEERKSKPPPSR